ncbi:hypothetical protein, partial [Streptomyces scabiei]|uniref:hypothetical protein n=1 Tax=Streptomyces scabiei TaxID=1930 RepID=UPI001C4FF6A4
RQQHAAGTLEESGPRTTRIVTGGTALGLSAVGPDPRCPGCPGSRRHGGHPGCRRPAEVAAPEIRGDALRQEPVDLGERVEAGPDALRRLDQGRARGGREVPG